MSRHLQLGSDLSHPGLKQLLVPPSLLLLCFVVSASLARLCVLRSHCFIPSTSGQAVSILGFVDNVQSLYLFSVIAVANYHRNRGLRQRVISQFCQTQLVYCCSPHKARGKVSVVQEWRGQTYWEAQEGCASGCRQVVGRVQFHAVIGHKSLCPCRLSADSWLSFPGSGPLPSQPLPSTSSCF